MQQDVVLVSFKDEVFFGYEGLRETCAKVAVFLSHVVNTGILISPQDIEKATYLLNSLDANWEQIRFLALEEFPLWIRDIGPVCPESSSLELIGFSQYKSSIEAIRGIRHVQEEIASFVEREIAYSPIIAAGGNLITDGSGLGIAFKPLIARKNSNLDFESVHLELKKLLGLRKLVFLERTDFFDNRFIRNKRALAGDYFVYGNGGHVDSFCRFVSGNKLLVSVPDLNDYVGYPFFYELVNYQDKVLSEIRNQFNDHEILTIFKPPPFPIEIEVFEGMPFKGMRYDSNERVVRDGDKIKYLPSLSYINFLECNGSLIIPALWKPGAPEEMKIRDQEAMKIFQSLFPESEVLQVPSLPLMLGGGGIRCISMDYPVAQNTRFTG